MSLSNTIVEWIRGLTLDGKMVTATQIVDETLATMRCDRCRKYDKKWRRCNSAQMVGGAYIEDASAFGCCHFSD